MLLSRMLRAVAWLRARPWGVFLVGILMDLALVVPAHFGGWGDTYIGVPAAVTSFVVVAGALIGGPRVGVALALVTGVAFDALVVTDRWLVTGLTSGIVLIVWLLAGLTAGMLGDRYRGQVTRALQQATDARAAVERVLEVTPAFHVGGDPDEVAKAVSAAAVETTGCSVAALLVIEGGHPRLAGPRSGEPAGRPTASPLDGRRGDPAEEMVMSLKPSFVSDVAAHGWGGLSLDDLEFADVASVLTLPAVLNGRPIAVLALGWRTRQQEPTTTWLASLQRFADHAAVALERARREEVERDAARLYRRFESSLMPQISVCCSDLQVGTSYSPGERRMRLGGDFLDLLVRSDGVVRVVVGDVAGHGPDAAALGSYLRAAWRALAHGNANAVELMATLNALVLEEADRAETNGGSMPVMATVCALELPADRSTATFVSAGHPPALLAVDGAITKMPVGGLPLGVEPCAWSPATVSLPARWTILIYTDGITEARAAPEAHARLGVDGLMALLSGSETVEEPTSEALRRLTSTVERMNGGPLLDDATLVALSRSALPTAGR